MSYDISYEEKNGKLSVQCDKELYKDIMKKFDGRWNKSQRFLVPIEHKADIDNLIANIKALASSENKEENEQNQGFVTIFVILGQFYDFRMARSRSWSSSNLFLDPLLLS